MVLLIKCGETCYSGNFAEPIFIEQETLEHLSSQIITMAVLAHLDMVALHSKKKGYTQTLQRERERESSSGRQDGCIDYAHICRIWSTV